MTQEEKANILDEAVAKYFVELFPSYAYTDSETAIDLMRGEILALRRESSRKNRQLNTVVGVAANLMGQAGISWTGEIAMLCNGAGDLDKFDSDWKDAGRRAFMKIRELQCQNCFGSGRIVVHGPTGEFSDQNLETCPDCEGTGRRGTPHYASKLFGFTWQIFNDIEDGLQLVLVSSNGTKRGTVSLKPSGIAGRFLWVAFDDEGIDRNSAMEETVSAAMSSVEAVEEGWGKVFP